MKNYLTILLFLLYIYFIIEQINVALLSKESNFKNILKVYRS